jgi:hypothetical protein
LATNLPRSLEGIHVITFPSLRVEALVELKRKFSGRVIAHASFPAHNPFDPYPPQTFADALLHARVQKHALDVGPFKSEKLEKRSWGEGSCIVIVARIARGASACAGPDRTSTRLVSMSAKMNNQNILFDDLRTSTP